MHLQKVLIYQIMVLNKFVINIIFMQTINIYKYTLIKRKGGKQMMKNQKGITFIPNYGTK